MQKKLKAKKYGAQFLKALSLKRARFSREGGSQERASPKSDGLRTGKEMPYS